MDKHMFTSAYAIGDGTTRTVVYTIDPPVEGFFDALIIRPPRFPARDRFKLSRLLGDQELGVEVQAPGPLMVQAAKDSGILSTPFEGQWFIVRHEDERESQSIAIYARSGEDAAKFWLHEEDRRCRSDNNNGEVRLILTDEDGEETSYIAYSRRTVQYFARLEEEKEGGNSNDPELDFQLPPMQ